MQTSIRLGLAGLVVLASGCASTITALTNRPITSDHLDEPGEENKLKSVSGDRRLVRVQLPNSKEPKAWKLCGETQADAITSRGGQSSLTVNDRASGADAYQEGLLLTYSRTELSDVVRQLSWQICNAYLNGAYDETGYAQRLDNLSHNAMAVLLARAMKGEAQPMAPPITGKVETVVLPPPLKVPAAAPETCKPAPDKPCPK